MDAREDLPPHPAPLRPIRDLFFDHTPFLQKVVGDPRAINRQLALIVD